jgi:DNA modification methylase
MKPYYEHAGITIYHGDCREILPSLAYDALLTDPPYGIGLRSNGHFSARNVVGDHSQMLGEFARANAEARGVVAIMFANPLKPWSGEWKQHLVWDKGEAVGSGGDPKSCWRMDWELIQCARIRELVGGRDSSVLRFHVRAFAPEYDFRFHPCQKPTALLRYLLLRMGDIGTVADPFMGSGSTLVAAKNLGRTAIGIEVEERYCEIAAKRLAQEVMAFA